MTTEHRKSLRIGATYQLLRYGIVDTEGALHHLAELHTPAEMRGLRNTVAIWRDVAAGRDSRGRAEELELIR